MTDTTGVTTPLPEEDNVDHVFVIALVCFGAGAILLFVGCGIFLCWCQRNRRRLELQKIRRRERERIRHLEEYSVKTGGNPDEYLKYGTGTSWGSISVHSERSRSQKSKYNNNDRRPRTPTSPHSPNSQAGTPTSPTNGHAFDWNDIGEQNLGYEHHGENGSIGGGSLGKGSSLGGGGSLQGQESVRGSDKCLTEHERQSARTSVGARDGDVAF